MAKKNFLPQNMQSLYTLYFVKKSIKQLYPHVMFTKQIVRLLVYQWLIMATKSSNIVEHEFFIYVYIYKSALYFYVDPTNWNHATIYDKSLREFSECTYTLSEFRRNNTMAGQVYSLCILIHSFCLPFSFFFKTTSRKTGLQASLIKRRWKEFEIVWFWSGYFEKEGR